MMTQYIDKTAIKAELEKRIEETKGMQPKFDQFWAGQISVFKGVLKMLDTLEVKEVDLEKEIDDYIDTMEVWEIQEAPLTSIENTAKHFFELGLKVQKGE